MADHGKIDDFPKLLPKLRMLMEGLQAELPPFVLRFHSRMSFQIRKKMEAPGNPGAYASVGSGCEPEHLPPEQESKEDSRAEGGQKDPGHHFPHPSRNPSRNPLSAMPTKESPMKAEMNPPTRAMIAIVMIPEIRVSAIP